MSDALKLERPLHYLHGAQRKAVDGSVGLTVEEAPLCQHLALRGHAESAALRSAVRAVTGVALPIVPLTCQAHSASRVFWQAPNEWMLVCDGPHGKSIADELRLALAGEHAAVVDVSGGQTLLKLAGPALATVLQKSCSYDFHPANFPVGKCVQTNFAKAGALVARLEEDAITLLVRRSFTDYIGHWLLDAADDFGVRISD